ncbi:MAG: hypothetical protein JF616_03725 [Fibrobacteres bacterium]|nr:hypothetical protein [Fibrobacterota bacterium]
MALGFPFTSVFADGVKPPDSTQNTEKGDKIDRMAVQVDEIHKDVVQSPIADKNWGVEVDPLYLLFFDKGGGFSGTISNFSLNRSAELAFPFTYEANSDDQSSHAFTIDAQYRYFLSGRQKGFYISGLTRFQNASYHNILVFDSTNGGRKTLNRMGVGFGIGGRIFSRMGLYWGWNVSLGRYFVGDKVGDGDLPSLPSLWMKDLILDVELLKIGFAF